jgi:hypothetical protein
MRPRIALLATALTAFACASVPGIASAAPHHNKGITINVAPKTLPAGEEVVIWGFLKSGEAGKRVVLYHHIAGTGTGYTVVQTTKTEAGGFYEFLRNDGIVDTNRCWYVVVPDLRRHSKTSCAKVSALVSISASTLTQDTNHTITFTGHVAPNHFGERVYLQEQESSSGDDWHTLKSAFLGPFSYYQIAYTWKQPTVRDVRVLFKGDERNVKGASDTVTVAITQAQNPNFTINVTPGYIINYGSAATISGQLMGITKPVQVGLYGHTHGQGYSLITTAMTDASGNYGFTGLSPSENTFYLVRTTKSPLRATAQTYLGVRDVLTLNPVTPTAKLGDTVTFSGTVAPNKFGHSIYLQRLGEDGDWHTIEIGTVSSTSSYSLPWTLEDTGVHEFRVHITGGPDNVDAATPPAKIKVS